MADEIKEVWLCKWALSDGVTKHVVRSVTEDGWVYLAGYSTSVLLGRDCAWTKVEADTLADAMRIKKIASLNKQIAKLETLRFGSAR